MLTDGDGNHGIKENKQDKKCPVVRDRVTAVLWWTSYHQNQFVFSALPRLYDSTRDSQTLSTCTSFGLQYTCDSPCLRRVMRKRIKLYWLNSRRIKKDENVFSFIKVFQVQDENGIESWYRYNNQLNR